MIFWILVVLLAAAIVLTFLVQYWEWNEIGGPLLLSLVTLLLGGMVAGGLFALSLLIPGTVIRPTDYELRAIGTSSSVSGRFYLGSGYVNGYRTLNYIKQMDGWSEIDQAAASASRVFEDAPEPTVTEYKHVYSNGWVVPWEFDIGWTYDFHIPEGSILEDFTITNE